MKKVWFWLFIFLVGIGLGLGAPSVAPKYLGQYFPTGLSATRSGVQGVVVKKQAEEDRLLLTISAPDGAMLATFGKKITEISLLVDEGDMVTLDTRIYAPFVTDPPILRVKKPAEFTSRITEPTISDDLPEEPELADPHSSSVLPESESLTNDEGKSPSEEPEPPSDSTDPPIMTGPLF
ncbi:MAG: hypothetical protein NPIRA05_19740 [Nitrospirales bacterium]|nr:MAG: hypothetical protein NPIRA05_19740 [Nitrospirales bacterium]